MDAARSLVKKPTLTNQNRAPEELLVPVKFIRFTEAVKELGSTHHNQDNERIFLSPDRREILLVRLGDLEPTGKRTSVKVRRFPVDVAVCFYELADEAELGKTYNPLPRVRIPT
jgi:hypothetical protein